MKTVLIIITISCLYLTSFAQINGNKKIITQTRSLGLFTQLEVDFPAEVEVICQTIPHLEITVDENVMPYINIKMEGSKLRILQGQWIEPSQLTRITIGTAFLHQLETGGYGQFWVRNIKTPEFRLINPVGTVELEGSTDLLKMDVQTGQADASRLKAKNIEVHISSFGSAIIYPTDLLEANISSEGSIIYVHKPLKIKGEGNIRHIDELEEKPLPKTKYIELTLKNNSNSKIDVYVQGPPHRRFSYGIPFKAEQKRTETFPVGTRIYLDRVITRKLLVTIEDKDENQTVNLFDR